MERCDRLPSFPAASQLASRQAAMPTYKLTYFPFRGRAEVARQLFHLAGVPFEDNRVKNEDWPALKATMPFAQMPMLEEDGKALAESFAINRYLAREFGFAGDSSFESAWVDALADQFKDYHREILPVLMVVTGFSQGDKEKVVKEIAEPSRDRFYGRMEKIAKDNGSNGHFVGSSLTWVDLLIADNVNIMQTNIPGHLAAYPTVLATAAKIEQTPKVKEWLEKRPPTNF